MRTRSVPVLAGAIEEGDEVIHAFFDFNSEDTISLCSVQLHYTIRLNDVSNAEFELNNPVNCQDCNDLASESLADGEFIR